jgi:UV DNA damage endonuclease
MTSGDEVRFRTITRARYLGLGSQAREAALRDVYADNLQRLFGALRFCQQHRIGLFRMLCGLFPLNDEPGAAPVLNTLAAAAQRFARQAEQLGVRVLMHPDQFVVLNSERPAVVQQSVHLLSRHALVMDMLGLPQNHWSPLIIHGGKGGRAEALIETIEQLPGPVRRRLVLENDENCYSAAEILDICRRAGVPMVFDPHHHVVCEELDSYEDPSVEKYVRLAAGTWPKPDWQIVHISNGASSFGDPRHSELITTMPSALFQAPWIEVEAKGKEEAIFGLRRRFPGLD